MSQRHTSRGDSVDLQSWTILREIQCGVTKFSCFLRLVHVRKQCYKKWLCWAWKELLDKLICFFVSLNIVHTWNDSIIMIWCRGNFAFCFLVMHLMLFCSLQKEKRNSNFMFLMIKFPRIHDDKVEYSVVHFEKVWFVMMFSF